MEKENKKGRWGIFLSWVKRISKVLFWDGRLMWIFLFVLALAIYIPSLLNFYSSDHITITATILQVSAFCIFWIRVCQLHKHYVSEGFWEAIKRWGRRFFPKGAEVNVPSATMTMSGGGELSGITKNKKLSIEERVELLEKKLDDLNTAQDKISEDLQNLESKLMDEVRGVETQMKKTEIKTKELQLKNLGRELIAVLWLISAALINAFPGSLQLLPYY